MLSAERTDGKKKKKKKKKKNRKNEELRSSEMSVNQRANWWLGVAEQSVRCGTVQEFNSDKFSRGYYSAVKFYFAGIYRRHW